jgi:lipid-binding SYLF domain-containing protein
MAAVFVASKTHVHCLGPVASAPAFVFSQQGLMAGISIEGAKISRINPKDRKLL